MSDNNTSPSGQIILSNKAVLIMSNWHKKKDEDIDILKNEISKLLQDLKEYCIGNILVNSKHWGYQLLLCGNDLPYRELTILSDGTLYLIG